MLKIEFYNVGQIVNTQGLKGEVKVISHTDFPEQRFQVDKQLYVHLPDGQRELLTVDGVRVHKGMVILHFAGHPSINDVEQFKKSMLQISAKQQLNTDLDEGEYFYQQVIGLKVYDLDDHYLGQIKDIMETGANDVWVVEREDNGKEILLPKIDQVIKKVDLNNRRVTIDLLEGLE